MSMPAVRLSDPVADVVLGPCPGCESWQLDYTDVVARTFFDTSDPVSITAPFHAAVEDILQSHLEECGHLQAWLLDVQ